MNTRRWLMAAMALALFVHPGAAQDEPKYPHVNLALDYRVDAKWPQKPKEYYWGHVPGVAVDAKDNVYVYTRANPPVQVYDSSGKFLRAWGEKTIGKDGA